MRRQGQGTMDMGGQQSLLDGVDDTPPVLTDRLFFALFPAPQAVPQINALGQQLQAQHSLTGKLLRPERFHITLHHVGDYPGLPPGVVASARQAGEALAGHAAFDVAFDRVGSFHGRAGKHPFVLRGDEQLAALKAFHKALGHALLRQGLKIAPSFTPHITLLYGDKLVAEQAVAPIAWAAQRFVLVRSLIGRSIYEELAAWPLVSTQQDTHEINQPGSEA